MAPISTILEPDTSTTTSTSTFKCPCTPSYTFISECPHSQTHLLQKKALHVLDVHAKERYLVAQFSSVFDGLKDKVQELEKKLAEDTKDYFQERALRAVLAYVREIMAVNELVLEEARRALWDGFERREGDSGATRLVEGVEGLGLNGEEGQGNGENEGRVEDAVELVGVRKRERQQDGEGDVTIEKEWEVIHEQYFDPNFC